jgi:hypothetical protein
MKEREHEGKKQAYTFEFEKKQKNNKSTFTTTWSALNNRRNKLI